VARKKVVLDTNIIVSAIVFGGKPRQVLSLVYSFQVQGFISRFIITEVLEVLRKKFDFPPVKLRKVEALLLKNFILVEPKKSLSLIRGCLADNRILECAREAKVDYLVSGDKKHLLPLKKVKNFQILTAGRFLSLYALTTPGVK